MRRVGKFFCPRVNSHHVHAIPVPQYLLRVTRGHRCPPYASLPHSPMIHCSILAEYAIKAAVADYRKKYGGESQAAPDKKAAD